MGWGWASQQWQNNVGSTIVVRQDGKPLLPRHVEALCNYCRYEIRPLLAHFVRIAPLQTRTTASGRRCPGTALTKDVGLVDLEIWQEL